MHLQLHNKMPFTQKLPMLPEAGQMPHKATEKATTIEDVVEGMYDQNRVINYIAENMEELANIVKDQSPIIENFKKLERLVANALKWAKIAISVFGLSAFGEALKWLLTLHH